MRRYFEWVLRHRVMVIAIAALVRLNAIVSRDMKTAAIIAEFKESAAGSEKGQEPGEKRIHIALR